jgi:hypothetical protein
VGADFGDQPVTAYDHQLCREQVLDRAVVEDEAVEADHQGDRLELQVRKALQRSAKVGAQGLLALEPAVGAATSEAFCLQDFVELLR